MVKQVVDTMTGNTLLSILRDKGEDLLQLLMERTIEPVVFAHLSTETEEESAVPKEDASLE